MNEILLKAIIDLAAFLELSGDDILDPDAATTQLDNLTAVLSGLTQPERDKFIAYIEKMSKDFAEHGSDERFLRFLLSFPESFGLRN